MANGKWQRAKAKGEMAKAKWQRAKACVGCGLALLVSAAAWGASQIPVTPYSIRLLQSTTNSDALSVLGIAITNGTLVDGSVTDAKLASANLQGWSLITTGALTAPFTNANTLWANPNGSAAGQRGVSTKPFNYVVNAATNAVTNDTIVASGVSWEPLVALTTSTNGTTRNYGGVWVSNVALVGYGATIINTNVALHYNSISHTFDRPETSEVGYPPVKFINSSLYGMTFMHTNSLWVGSGTSPGSGMAFGYGYGPTDAAHNADNGSVNAYDCTFAGQDHALYMIGVSNFLGQFYNCQFLGGAFGAELYDGSFNFYGCSFVTQGTNAYLDIQAATGGGLQVLCPCTGSSGGGVYEAGPISQFFGCTFRNYGAPGYMCYGFKGEVYATNRLYGCSINTYAPGAYCTYGVILWEAGQETTVQDCNIRYGGGTNATGYWPSSLANCAILTTINWTNSVLNLFNVTIDPATNGVCISDNGGGPTSNNRIYVRGGNITAANFSDPSIVTFLDQRMVSTPQAPTPAAIGAGNGITWVSNSFLYYSYTADGTTSNAAVKIAP